MTYLAADQKRQEEYHRHGIGTKICLKVKSLEKLLHLQAKAKELGLPHYLVVDDGRNTEFNGEPTTSALGLGPLYP
jgi:peptidyl-tRNA hydrolase